MLCRCHDTGLMFAKALWVAGRGEEKGDLFESRRRAWPQVKVLPPAMDGCSTRVMFGGLLS